MVRLKPRHGYIPKVLSMPFRAQCITLQAFHSPDPTSEVSQRRVLCPVCALCAYVDKTTQFCMSKQLFVCFGGTKKGHPVLNQKLSHWVVEAICLAYASRGVDCLIAVCTQPALGVVVGLD